MNGSASAVLLVLIMLVTPLVGVSAPPAMPEQVPELMHRSILPVTSDVPTCVSIADKPRGESDYIVVGLANGTVNVFHPSGTDMIVRVVELDRGRPVDDVCAINLAGAGPEFALLALQGSALRVMDSEVAEVKKTMVLPPPTGTYALVRVPAAGDGESGRANRALLCDDRSVSEIRVGALGHRWSLVLEPVLSDPRGLSVHVLSDRVVLATRTHGVHEYTADAGLLGSPDQRMDGSEDPASLLTYPPGSGTAIVSGDISTEGDRLNVWIRGADGVWSSAAVALEDSLTLAVTVRDSMLLLGGAMTRDELRRTGWLALVDARGEIVATSEHGRTVAAATRVGEWLAVQGERRNLSLYDMDLNPIWDNSSQIAPLALLAAHLSADESEDLVVVGMRMFAVETERVDAIREVLDRPDFMVGANARGNTMYLDRPMLNVYYSSAGELAEIIEDRRRRVDEHRRSRDYIEAARHAFTARAAAAALGHWGDAESLREEGASLLGMPRRDRATLIATVLLLVAGLWTAVAAVQDASRRGRSKLWWINKGWQPALLAVAALSVWSLLGSVYWSPALIAGGLVAAGGVSVAWLRRDERPQRRAAGAAIEELELRIREFTHGGDGSSRQGRKKLTTLAYLIQEMLESMDDPERYEMLRQRLGLRYGSFYPAKWQLAMDLPDAARVSGVAVEEAEKLAAAADTFHETTSVLVDTPDAGGELRRQELRSAGGDALEAWQAIREAADAAAAVVRENPGSSVTACIELLLDERREVLESMGVAVTCNLGLDSSEDAVAIQRSKLQFVIENLVTNGLRAMDDSIERKLSFVGTARPGAYELRVTDTGCGIPESKLREIFIPTESVLGGLGLPHSREILRRVSGNIEVERTEVGVGTTMLVTLLYWAPETAGGE